MLQMWILWTYLQELQSQKHYTMFQMWRERTHCTSILESGKQKEGCSNTPSWGHSHSLVSARTYNCIPPISQNININIVKTACVFAERDHRQLQDMEKEGIIRPSSSHGVPQQCMFPKAMVRSVSVLTSYNSTRSLRKMHTLFQGRRALNRSLPTNACFQDRFKKHILAVSHEWKFHWENSVLSWPKVWIMGIYKNAIWSDLCHPDLPTWTRQSS